MGKTDWQRLKNMTDEEIEQNALNDPDAPTTDTAYWNDAKVIMPEGSKEFVGIRFSSKVLEFFKKDGKKGYQGRINAVLEAYVDHELSKDQA